MDQNSDPSSDGYQHQQQLESEGDRRNFQETLSSGAYYQGQVGYSSSSDFSVSNRLLNTQQVHPKPFQYNTAASSNNHLQHQNNYNYPPHYYGWLSSMPTDQGTIRQPSASRHFEPPPNQTVYQLPSNHFHHTAPALSTYEHHQFTTIPPVQCNTLPHHTSPTPANHCNSLQASPSNTSWNNTGYPFTTDSSQSIVSSQPKNGYSLSSIMSGHSNGSINQVYAEPNLKENSPGIEMAAEIDNVSNGKRDAVTMLYEDRPSECDEEEDDDSDSKSNTENESSEPKKPKRTRTAFTTQQLDQLEIYFSMSPYPDAFTRDDISRRLNIKEDRIQVWFQNRRARHRKQERTGSVSIRSRVRQQRVQRMKESQAVVSMYRGYPAQQQQQQSNGVYPTRMISPHNPHSQAVSQFSFHVMTNPTPNSVTTSSPLPLASSGYPFTLNEAFLSHPPAVSVQDPTTAVLNGNGNNGHNSSSYSGSPPEN